MVVDRAGLQESMIYRRHEGDVIRNGIGLQWGIGGGWLWRVHVRVAAWRWAINTHRVSGITIRHHVDRHNGRLVMPFWWCWLFGGTSRTTMRQWRRLWQLSSSQAEQYREKFGEFGYSYRPNIITYCGRRLGWLK